MNDREAHILQAASRLLAALLTRQPNIIGTEDMIRMRWASIDTARRMADEIQSLESPGPPEEQMEVWIEARSEDSAAIAPGVLDRVEGATLLLAMDLCGRNKKRAAELLGLKRTTFLQRWKRFEERAAARES